MVEYSLDLEKALSIVKEENQKLKRRIALKVGNENLRGKVEEEELFRKQSDAAIESKDGQVSTPGTPN